MAENLFLNVPRYRVALVRECRGRVPAGVSAPDQAYALFAPYFADMDREAFVLVGFDNRNRPIGTHVVSVGTVDQTLVCPRDIFKAALLMNATGVILAHNHPSGDCEPSSEDRQVTARLEQAGELMNVHVLDHLVFGSDAFYSLKLNAKLPTPQHMAVYARP